MLIRWMLFLSLGLVISSGSAFGADAPPLEVARQLAVARVTAALAPSLVRIETVGGAEKVGAVVVGQGVTTGVVVSPNGAIVASAYGLAHRPAGIVVTFADGVRQAASIGAVDHSRRLVLLRSPRPSLTAVKASKKAKIEVGQTVFALGRALPVKTPTVSGGIVSALGRIHGRAIQTDAKVSPLNYGGVLANYQGETLGVLTPLSPTSEDATAGADWYDSGIGFAIPLEDILANLPRWEKGDLYRGILGVIFQSTEPFGAAPKVQKVTPGSPAALADIRPDDVFASIDGIATPFYARVQTVLGPKYAGDKVTVAVRRDSETLTKTIVLTQPPKK